MEWPAVNLSEQSKKAIKFLQVWRLVLDKLVDNLRRCYQANPVSRLVNEECACGSKSTSCPSIPVSFSEEAGVGGYSHNMRGCSLTIRPGE